MIIYCKVIFHPPGGHLGDLGAYERYVHVTSKYLLFLIYLSKFTDECVDNVTRADLTILKKTTK